MRWLPIKIGNLVLESDGSYISFNKVQPPISNRIPVCSAGQTFQELLSNLGEKTGGVEFTEDERKIIEKPPQRDGGGILGSRFRRRISDEI